MTMIMNNSPVEKGVTREVGIRLLNSRTKTIEDKRDEVAVEEPLHILVNGERYASIICSPSDQQALVVGNMAAEGIIRGLDEIMDITGLSEKQHILTEHLSLPEKKNVEIARALAGNPKLILFDEVSSGLTGKEIQGRINLMKRLSSMGITIIAVEHIMRFIKEISDRVGVLHAGELICEGTPREVAADKKVIEAYLGGKKL